MQVRGGFRRDPGTASCISKGPLSATCPQALPCECSSIRAWIRLDSRGWAWNVQPDAMCPPTSADDGRGLRCRPTGDAEVTAHSLAGRQTRLGDRLLRGSMESRQARPREWSRASLMVWLLVPASRTGPTWEKPPDGGVQRTRRDESTHRPLCRSASTCTRGCHSSALRSRTPVSRRTRIAFGVPQ